MLLKGARMVDTLYLNSQKYGVKKGYEPLLPDEVKVKFQSTNEISNFFSGAMKNPTNCKSVQTIANHVSPSFCCRSIKHRQQSSSQDALHSLISEIGTGNANVIIKSDVLKSAHQKNQSEAVDDDNIPQQHDFVEFVKKQATDLKNAFSRLVHADYHILENVYHFDENSKGFVPAVIDASSIESHSTGWKNLDDPFEIAALGAFKTVAAYRISTFLRLSKSITAAAVMGSQSELISGEYMVNGKSIMTKKWYGSYGIRYNLRTLSFEVAWVKFKGCSQGERMMVELKRKDRLMFHDKSIYNHPEVLIPPFVPMEEFLAEYKKGLALPEHDVMKPIKIG